MQNYQYLYDLPLQADMNDKMNILCLLLGKNTAF